MNAPRTPPRFVPTLTEVVELAPPSTPAAPHGTDPELLISDGPLPVAVDVVPALVDDATAAQPQNVAPATTKNEPTASEQAMAATPTEDVPAFLLATQPVAVAAAAAEPEAAAEAVRSAERHIEPNADREAQMVHNVLAELQQRADLMLEYRMRETLTPILARLCDALIKEARQDLAATLRDVVARAVAQELARQRQQAHPHEGKTPPPSTH